MRKRIIFEALVAVIIIVLTFTLYLMVTGNAPVVAVQWELTDNESVYYMAEGDNGRLFAFLGNSIYAIDNDGSTAWKYSLPDNRWPGSSLIEPITAYDNGILYVYARSFGGDISAGPVYGDIIAISSDGTTMWSMPLLGDIRSSGLQADNDRVYIYCEYHETVLNSAGCVLWSPDNVFAAPAIDEEGIMYLIPSHPVKDGVSNQGIIESYYPNGTLFWREPINEDIPAVHALQYDTLPVYHDGVIYIPLYDGMLAMDRNSNVLWVKRFNGVWPRLFSQMPFDAKGNIYLIYEGAAGTEDRYLAVIDRDGRDVITPRLEKTEYLSPIQEKTRYIEVKDGIAFTAEKISVAGYDDLLSLDTYEVTALDFLTGEYLWSYKIPVSKKTTVTLGTDNIGSLLLPYDRFTSARYHGSADIAKSCEVGVTPGSEMTYLNLWSCNYERPIIPGTSGCTYSGGLYAVDRNGKLVWHKDTDSYITAIKETNGTILYSTSDGKMLATKVDMATGVAIAAVSYLFIRFILVGALARAKNVIDKNDNRNLVLKYVIDNPGSTLYEVSRGLDMNLGTVRYHMAILGINHRIVSQQADSKYVRYFPNSNSYSKEEQLVISLMRREAIKKVLGLLLERPGMSNIELSRELGLPESATSKYMKELLSMGIVRKKTLPGGRLAYSVAEEQVEVVSNVIERIKESG